WAEIMRVNLTLFKSDNVLLNSFNVFILTLLGCMLGSHARMSGIDLSVLWPVNILVAALFYRCRYLNTPWYYGVAYSAMIAQDGLLYGWGISAFTINSANLVFIFVLVKLLCWPGRYRQQEADISTSLHLFSSCMIAALSCALVGAFTQHLAEQTRQSFQQDVLNWFSDQFYTAVLFLPLLLTLRSDFTLRMPTADWRSSIPLVFLVLSLGLGTLIGPIAILAFPLPALTWCAIVYPLWAIRLITLCTGIVELIATALHVQGIYDHQDALFMQEITIARISIAAIIFSPLLMAMNAKTIRQLNQRLLMQASHDFLTHLLSRYGFNDALNRYAKIPRYRQAAINMMLVDIDHFKTINDSYGHDNGDIVLKHVANLIQQSIPEPGLVSRIGAEEFAVVCFDFSERDFFALAEQLRTQIHDTPCFINGSPISVAVSIGIAHAPSSAMDLTQHVHQLFAAADKNLYIAKREGRNRTVQ
ncbi:GGDEF domain-containing protein, partial [Candidatus Symbiopectobacterium sp. NZEC135]|uniref:GGDEF domain-containing protein n=1 Tax=Candidatus Symbiopectobacterium sp. NZEC135 TaxID=2820471 RepID=UPI00222681E3